MTELTKAELKIFIEWLKDYRNWVFDSSLLLDKKTPFDKRMDDYIDYYLRMREQIDNVVKSKLERLQIAENKLEKALVEHGISKEDAKEIKTKLDFLAKEFIRIGETKQ